MEISILFKLDNTGKFWPVCLLSIIEDEPQQVQFLTALLNA